MVITEFCLLGKETIKRLLSKVQARKGEIMINVKIDDRESSKVAIIESTDILINDPQDALDLMATIMHLHDCTKIVINESSITKSFFDLKTESPGDITKVLNLSNEARHRRRFFDIHQQKPKGFHFRK